MCPRCNSPHVTASARHDKAQISGALALIVLFLGLGCVCFVFWIVIPLILIAMLFIKQYAYYTCRSCGYEYRHPI